jgi:hypothetical protein
VRFWEFCGVGPRVGLLSCDQHWAGGRNAFGVFSEGAWIGVRSCGVCEVVFWAFVVRSGRWPSNVGVGPFPRTLPWAFVVRSFGAWE